MNKFSKLYYYLVNKQTAVKIKNLLVNLSENWKIKWNSISSLQFFIWIKQNNKQKHFFWQYKA